MRISFDRVKNERNIRERGLSFESAADFDFETALVHADRRRDYGEIRMSQSACFTTVSTFSALQKRLTESASSAFGRPTHERSVAMPKSKPLIDSQGEVREITTTDLKRFRPAKEVLSPSLRKKLGVRGPQKAPTKERVTIRLSQDVVKSFRATGEGWQTRVDAALQDWLKSHKPA